MVRLKNAKLMEPLEKTAEYVDSIVSVSVVRINNTKAYIIAIQLVVRMRVGDWARIYISFIALLSIVDISTRA